MKMRINAEALAARPKSGDLVELRYVIDGRTVSVMLETKNFSIMSGTTGVQLIGKIAGADYAPEGIDGRNERQRESINRLLAHLEAHCPEFISGQVCQHNGRTET